MVSPFTVILCRICDRCGRGIALRAADKVVSPNPAPSAEASRGTRRGRARGIGAVVVVSSLAWTVIAWSLGYSRPDVRLDQLGMVAAALVASEAAFIGGLIVMVAALPHAATIANGASSGRWAVFRRRELRPVLAACSASPAWRRGFLLNWIGAAGSTAILVVVALLYTPPAAWGTTLVLMADLLATFGLRIPLWRRRSSPMGDVT